MAGSGSARCSTPSLRSTRLLVAPDTARQVFNDTEGDALWLVVGAPREGVSSTLEMSAELLARMYPEGPRALPPELGGGQFEPPEDS